MFKQAIIVLFLFSTFNASAQTWTKNEIKNIQAYSIKSLPSVKDPSNRYLNNQSAINFGKALFYDVRLSSNTQVSCNSCHSEQHAFTDHKKLAIGLRVNFRNTPTLLNVGQQNWFFADGAKDSLWTQVLSSIENPAEQNFTRMEIMRLISTDKSYRQQYQQIFGQALPNESSLELLPKKAGPNAKLEDLIAWKKLGREQRAKINKIFTNSGKSIVAFVATIQSKPSRFDDFAEALKQGELSTLFIASEQRGLRLFLSQDSGCANCHSGPLFSNKTFHNIGTGIPGKDNGRSEIIESVVRDEFNCLSQYSDAKPEQCPELNYINRNKHQLAGAYKTSTLRSIKNTAPYMHDGRFESLKEVLKYYVSTSQSNSKKTDLMPINLDEKQQADLINFLLTL